MSPLRRRLHGFTLALCTLAAVPALRAAEPAPLPEPLTLEYALSLADEAHPMLQQAEAAVAAARAGLRQAESQSGFNVSVEGRLRWVEPPETSPDQDSEDHKVGLFLRKDLYDFGRSEAREAAASAVLAAGEWRYRDSRRQRRIEIMGRYFDVLRADLDFARADEAMAVAYVTLDRLRNRQELGQVSDIEVLEMESEYQRIRRERYASQAAQRASRARLALALNRPGMLPASLSQPELPQLGRELPEYEALLEKALDDNPTLHAVRAELNGARERVAAARAGRWPRIQGEVEAAEYSRDLGSNDQWRAGVYFELPLYDSGGTDSAVAREQADLYRLQARLSEAEYALREAVLELWLELGTLQVQREEMYALQDYRDIYLDRSRAIYELEVKADLGDAMVRLTESQLAAADTEFKIALAWERMDALTGGPLEGATQPVGGGENE